MNQHPEYLGRGFGPYRKGDRITPQELRSAHFPLFVIDEGESNGIPVRNVVIVRGLREHGDSRFTVDCNWAFDKSGQSFSIWDHEFRGISSENYYYAIHTTGTP